MPEAEFIARLHALKTKESNPERIKESAAHG
jgi:hypothetical protein